MTYSNRDLVVFFIRYKLSQRNYQNCQLRVENPCARIEAEMTSSTSANGLVVKKNGTGNIGAPQCGIEAIKAALQDSADEFELRYTRAFSDLSSQLHITSSTAYNSFESVMDEVFRDGVNWGRVIGLFAFGGALCIDCVEKDMNHMVSRIEDWMTMYLDSHIEPWIQSQGGWDRFAEIFGRDSAAEARRFEENLRRWLLLGVVLLTGVLIGSFIVKKHQ